MLTTHETITLDGRKFGGTGEETADQFEYVEQHLQLALESHPAPRDPACAGRTKEQKSADLLTQILLSGQTGYILAGCLTEEGHVWNRKDADANASRFSQISDPEEKITIHLCIAEFVNGFSFRGWDPSEISRPAERDSSPSSKVPPAKNAVPPASRTWVN